MRQSPRARRRMFTCFVHRITIPVVMTVVAQSACADLVTSWTQVDKDTVTADVAGVTLTVDSSSDVFSAGEFSTSDLGLTSIDEKFQALAIGSAATLTLTLPSTHRFTSVTLVGVDGTGSLPVLTIGTTGLSWSLTEAVVGPPTTNVSGDDLNYFSPFVASLTNVNGLQTLQIVFSDQMEDDPFGIGVDIAPVPEPAAIHLMALAALLTGWWKRRRNSGASDKDVSAEDTSSNGTPAMHS